MWKGDNWIKVTKNYKGAKDMKMQRVEYGEPCWSVFIDIVTTKVLLKTREYAGEP